MARISSHVHIAILLITHVTQVLSIREKPYKIFCGNDITRSCDGVSCQALDSGIGSRLRCANLCSLDVACFGINVIAIPDASLFRCELIFDYRVAPTRCSQTVARPGSKYYELSNCLHEGEWNGATCVCPAGWTGDRCQTLPIDCSDAVDAGMHPGNPFHTVTILPVTAPEPFQVRCYLEWGGWTIIQARHFFDCLDTTHFDRGWQDYKEGFGNLECDFWLGNDKLHWLTSQQDYLLDITVRPQDTSISDYVQAYYVPFSVGNEATNYQVSIGPEATVHSTYAGNSLTPPSNPAVSADGMAFSTFDRDNDASTGNCAEDFRSGWWFNDCTASNLNGVRVLTDTGVRNTTVPSILWQYNYGAYAIKSVDVKLQPV